eukprot:1160986-Pelagomonas_calceolata.AAC.2
MLWSSAYLQGRRAAAEGSLGSCRTPQSKQGRRWDGETHACACAHTHTQKRADEQQPHFLAMKATKHKREQCTF